MVSVNQSVKGEDYKGGLMEKDPSPEFWWNKPEYSPYLTLWKNRPEYKKQLNDLKIRRSGFNFPLDLYRILHHLPQIEGHRGKIEAIADY